MTDNDFNEYCARRALIEERQSQREFAIEELEKIKADINLEDIDCQYEEDYVYSGGLQKAIEIIDNRISKLKGENNV